MAEIKQDSKCLNPNFKVIREELYRNDKTDIMHDVVYREDDGSQISIVSRDYQLVPHEDAINFIAQSLKNLNIKNEVSSIQLSNNGARLFYKITFPDYKFNAAEDISNTAIDGDENKDELVPTITLVNSYDRSLPFALKYGAFRFVCSNGMYIGKMVQDEKIIHKYNNVNLDLMQKRLIENIEKTVFGIKKNIENLNQKDGQYYFEIFMKDESIPNIYKLKMIEDMIDFVDVDMEKNKETNQIRIANYNEKQTYSAYLVFCLLTDIATHFTKSIMVEHCLQKKIAKTFMNI